MKKNTPLLCPTARFTNTVSQTNTHIGNARDSYWQTTVGTLIMLCGTTEMEYSTTI